MTNLQTAPDMAFVVKSEREWLNQHAVFLRGQWFCRKTKEMILVTRMNHMVLEKNSSGIGYVRKNVFHAYCPACDKKPRSENGSIVQTEELISV